MGTEHDIAEGLRMGAIAVVSAVVTATLVIGAGRALTPDASAVRAARAHASPAAVEVAVLRAAAP